MELRFSSLVIETTDRCNAKCAMCYQSAGPKGSDTRGDNRLPLAVSLRVIDEAAVLPELVGRRVHVSGGEGFLNFDEMLTLLGHASDIGFQDVGATTNAFWAQTRDRALARCTALADAGVTYLEISSDHWHDPYIAKARIGHLLWASRRTGIRPILRLLSSRRHHMEEALAGLSDADLVHVQIANSRVQPVGRAAEMVPADEIYYGRGPEGCCEQLLNLTIGPNGNVYPCCAGADMTNALACGNVLSEPLADAVLKMRTDYLIRSIIHRGAGQLIPVLHSLGLQQHVKTEYASICHLCWDVFHDDAIAARVRAHFESEAFEQLLAMLTSGTAEPEPTASA